MAEPAKTTPSETEASAAAPKPAAETTVKAQAAAVQPKSAEAILPGIDADTVLSFVRQGQDRLLAAMELASERFDQSQDNLTRAQKAINDSRRQSLHNARSMGALSLDSAQEQAQMCFDAWRNLLNAESFSEVLELQTSLARDLVETQAANAQAMRELIVKAWEETGSPVSMEMTAVFTGSKPK